MIDKSLKLRFLKLNNPLVELKKRKNRDKKVVHKRPNS
ncbi:hypothetical protein EZS27_006222 [termite gut metagenome]|uniref:Uncharacterized protein n=1 Tax=termite gut metagenome TaxID=433724 RepID=A0A5J4SLG9_9ZZZZ